MYAQVVNALTIYKFLSIIKVVNTSLVYKKSCSVFGHSKIEITENLKERLTRLIADTHEIIEFLEENRWLTDVHKKFISAIKKELTKLS